MPLAYRAESGIRIARLELVTSAGTFSKRNSAAITLALVLGCTNSGAKPDGSASDGGVEGSGGSPDGTPAADGSMGEGPVAGLACTAAPGALVCAPGQECCGTTTMPETLSCAAKDTCGMTYVIQCDGGEDCPSGQRCCAIFNTAKRSVKAACVAGDVCKGAWWCHVAADCPAAAPACCYPPGYTLGECLVACK